MSAPKSVENIGTRRELFVDDFMLAEMSGGAVRRLHEPRPREIVLVHDCSWEGNTSGYHTFFQDGDKVRVYYRGSQHNDRMRNGSVAHQVTCMAESDDGIHFYKPALGVVKRDDAVRNNIVHDGPARHNFAPFKDSRPDCPPEERYKSLGGSKGLGGLFAYVSSDGIRWTQAAAEPVVTDGVFDSQNLAFWDGVRSEYRLYYRDFKDGGEGQPGRRDIKTAASTDFIHWSEGVWLEYTGAPDEQLYTNQVLPCPRAPHLLLGFPTRYLPDRGQITEGLLMSSRNGVVFQRWGEALMRPGPNLERWGNRCNYIWHGLIETPSDLPGAPNEWSLYSTEGYYEGAYNRVRRYAIRQDGFVSVNAPLAGGEMVTRPFVFDGQKLILNLATSAAGAVRVELQSPDGRAYPGFEIDQCEEIWGDSLDREVVWRDDTRPGRLSGQPVRMRVLLRDADLFSFRFAVDPA